VIRLVLGGEKSGKSDLAWELFRQGGDPGVVLAMGLARDMAFRRQILDHRLRRDPSVPLMEPGIELPRALGEAAAGGLHTLVDSLDFWLFSCMEAGRDLSGDLEESLEAFAAPDGPHCVLVSCEVGLGPMAATSLARRFARGLGALNQRLAARALDVRLVVAGLPVILK
jgi:adenosylcobinamide kinase/adenosylcobinamide-phosphate guanylyltransferase